MGQNPLKDHRPPTGSPPAGSNPHEPARCRAGCGACCIAPSISSPIPGMPDGKPAGVSCVQLDEENRCRIFGHPERPVVCTGLAPAADMCGENRESAMRLLTELERVTR